MIRREFSHRSLGGARRGRRWLFVASVVAVVLLGIDVVSGGVIRTQVRSVTSGIANISSLIRENGYFASKRSLAKENAQLRANIQYADEARAMRDFLVAQNGELRLFANLHAEEGGVTAPVISSVRASPYGTFMVRAGAQDGIAEGDLVLSPGGFVVGRVAEVGERTTLVRVLFAPGSEIDVIVSQSALVAEGRGSGNARIAAPRALAVATQTPVTAPSVGGKPIGIIGQIKSDPSEADQVLYVSLPVQLDALSHVYITRL